MNIDVRGFDSDRKRTDEEKEIDQIAREYRINMLKSRRRIKNREKTKENILWAAIATVVITIIGIAAAVGYKNEDKNFSDNAFTEKDAPFSIDIPENDSVAGIHYYHELPEDEISNTNGMQK
jgi:hypothetical protein